MDGFPSRNEALQDFFEEWQPDFISEYVPLDQAIGRITARDIYAEATLPVVRASMLDGIAVKSSNFVDGQPDTSTWKYGVDYVRADTGDDFDDAFDAVIKIEDVTFHEDGSISLDESPVKPMTGVHSAGSTVTRGDLLLEANLPIRANDLAALISGGITMVPVCRKPRVAFIPTGSELIPAGVQPLRGQNIDTNSLMVKTMLEDYGAEPLIFPIVYDNEAALEEAFEKALSTADVVIINGGSAVGAEDFNIRLIEKRGKVVHHYIAAVPGRPMMLAVADQKPVIDLPGPTLAAYFGAQWCLQAVVARCLNVPARSPLTVQACATQDCSAPPQMDNIGMIHAERLADGTYTATPIEFKKNMMSALTANAQRVSPIGESGYRKGDIIEIELLRSPEYL